MTFIYTPHARLRMRQRGLARRLIEAAIIDPDRISASFLGRRVARKSVRGKPLEVVFKRLDGQTIVITAYWLETGT